MFKRSNDDGWMDKYQADVNGAINIADRYLTGKTRFRERTKDDDIAADGRVRTCHETTKSMANLNSKRLGRIRLVTTESFHTAYSPAPGFPRLKMGVEANPPESSLRLQCLTRETATVVGRDVPDGMDLDWRGSVQLE